MAQQFWHDPLLPFVESRRAWKSRACYQPHTHPAFSIGAIDAGRSILRIEGRAEQPLEAGDVVFIPENCPHACNPQPDVAWSYQMLYLDVDWLNNLWEEARQDDSGQRMRHPTHYRDIALYHQYCALNDLLFDDVPPELKEEALIGFLVGLSPETTLAPEITPKWVPAMQKKLLQHCEHHWSITHLAAEVGLSRFHLIRIFRRHTGLTPHAYLLDCRINKARHLLREGVSLAELAQHLGFSDQSHFQKAFRQRVCATPGDYLQQMRR